MKKTDTLNAAAAPYLAGAIGGRRWAASPFLTIVASILLGPSLACAQPYYALEYFGGPVLETFQIHPLYYGDWSTADVEAHQNYLKSLTEYISGKNAPAGQQPVTRQYGVNSASVVGAVKAGKNAVPKTLSRQALLDIIEANQKSTTVPHLPPFGPTTLIAIFLAHNFQTSDCDGCGFHASINPDPYSTTGIWMAVPQDTGTPPNQALAFQLLTAHEVFESATDPGVGDPHSWGWLTGPYLPAGAPKALNDEMVDECGVTLTIALSNLGIQIPSVMDNSGGVFVGNPAQNQPSGGTCSSTGYTSLDEIQVYGSTLSDYKTKYDSLWNQGWRLYILQSYVLADGGVRYNAVWRPAGNGDEIQIYEATLQDFLSQYNTLWPLGWRIYILDSYVKGGTVYFNAVWRPGDVEEIQQYEDTAAYFVSQFYALDSQTWRFYLLQSNVIGSSVVVTPVWRKGVTEEILFNQLTFQTYKTQYDTLWTQGWRLFLLQSYLLSDGTLVYKGVFHPGNHGEVQIYGATYNEYLTKYDTLWPEGWRLYILQAFVAADGTVHYNAVWRQSTIDRPL